MRGNGSCTCAVSPMQMSGGWIRPRQECQLTPCPQWRLPPRALMPSPAFHRMGVDWRSCPIVPANLRIWVADEDGTNAVQLTSFGRHPGFPRWSPDGKLIAFHGDLRDRPDVVVLPAGGGQPRILTSSLTNAGYPSFSRDGHSIYFCVVQDKHGRIWKVPSAGGEPVQVTSNAGTLSMESPDGRDLYYAETTERPSAVWRQPVAGGAPVKVLDGAVLGNFDVVDGGIYYITRVLGEAGAFLTDRPGGDTRLQYFDFSKGSSVTVAHNLGTVGFGLSASRDGRRVFFTRIDSSVDELMRVENFR